MNRGWQCPSCGRCYAPWKAACHHCPQGMTGASNTNGFHLTPAGAEKLNRTIRKDMSEADDE